MRKKVLSALLVLLIASTFPFGGFWFIGPVAALDSKPDLEIRDVRYSLDISGNPVVTALVANNGSDSGPFNITFYFAEPFEIPDPVETQFEWTNVSNIIGSAVEVQGNGTYSSTVVLESNGNFTYRMPFAVNFFGVPSDRLFVSSDGWVGFIPEGAAMPFAGTIDGGFWHLNVSDGYVLVTNLSESVLIEWLGSGEETVNFQVLITENGTVVWRYLLGGDGAWGGYWVSIADTWRGLKPKKGKAYLLEIPDVASVIRAVPVEELSAGGVRSIDLPSPISQGYVLAVADKELETGDERPENNFMNAGIWPSDYWIENATVRNEPYPGGDLWVDVKVRSASQRPRARVELLMNDTVVATTELAEWNFNNGTADTTLWWNPVLPGNYILSVRVVSDDDVNPDNNRYTIGNYSFPLPDFRVDGISVEMPECTGGWMAVQFNVTNSGGQWDGSVEYEVLVGTSNGTESNKGSVILWGNTGHAFESFSVPPGTIENVTVIIDPNNKVPEKNEANNEDTEGIGRNYPQVDVAITSMDAPATATSGDWYTVNITLESNACFDGPIDVSLYENGNVSTSERYYGINGTKEVGLSWSPRRIGTANLTATVAVEGDPNEDNNRVSTTVNVHGPDFFITNVTLVSFDGIAGSEAVFNVTVKNTGASFDGYFSVEVMGGLGYSSGPGTDTTYVSGLESGESKTVTLRVYPNGGTNELSFEIDPGNRIPESDESNNGFTYVLNVPRPNFIVEDVNVPRDVVGDVKVNVTVRNTGAPYNGTQYGMWVILSTNGSTDGVPFYGLIGQNESTTLRGDLHIQAPGGVVNATIGSNVNETSKLDNSFLKEFSTEWPDLVVSIEPMEVAVGEGTFKARVENIGNATINLTSGIFLTYSVTSENGTPHNGVERISDYPLTIAPGVSREVTLEIPLKSGENKISVLVDAYGDVSEANESNNVASAVVNAGVPDFSIERIAVPEELLNGSAFVNKLYTINVTIVNRGSNFSAYDDYLWVSLLVDGVEQSVYTTRNLAGNESWNLSVASRFSPGKHNVTIVVDPQNEWQESNESNNRVAFETGSLEGPDLVPVGVTWSPLNFSAGDRVEFTIYLENRGGGVYLGYYPSPLYVQVLGENGVLAEGYAYSWDLGLEMRPNETEKFTWTWSSALPGNVTLKAMADYDGVIEESNESNNVLLVPLGETGKSDLTIRNLSIESPAYWKTITLTAVVENLGDPISRPIPVQFFLNGQSRTVWITGLGGNESRNVSAEMVVTGVGSISAGAAVDPYNYIPETNESNNAISRTLEVQRPDLILANYTWVEEDVPRGYLSFDVTVLNDGGDEYREFALGLYINGALISTVNVPGLKSGERATERIKAPLPGEGDFKITLAADVHNIVPELSETNNNASETLRIELPDLVAEGFEVPEMNANERFILNVTVANGGNVLSLGFYVSVLQNGREIGRTWVAKIPANFSLIVGVPVKPLPGDANITAVVDSRGAIVESNEENNRITRTAHVSAPDIEVVSINPGSFEYSGEIASAEVVLRNTGDYPTGVFDLTVKSDRVLGSTYVEPIGPGEEVEVIVQWLVEEGNYTLSAVADYRGDVVEYREDNNEAGATVSVPLPDIVVEEINTDRAGAGEWMSVSAVLANKGETTKKGFYMGLYVDSMLAGIKRVYGIDGNGSTTVNFTWKATYGNHTLEVRADIYGEVGENNKSNNRISKTVSVDDHEPPRILSFYPPNGSFTSDPRVGALVADDGAGVSWEDSFIRLLHNGVEVPGSTASSSGWLVFRNSTHLEDGNYTALVFLKDRAGNSVIEAWNFVVDREPPRIEVNVTDGATYEAVSPGVRVVDEALRRYTVLLNGVRFSGGTIRKDGHYVLTVLAEDMGGNRANYTVLFSVNGRPSPPSGFSVLVSGDTVELSWLPSGDPDVLGYYVYLDGKRINDEPIEATTFRDALGDSLNYSVTAVDLSGKESEPALPMGVRLSIEAGRLAGEYPSEINVTVETLDRPLNGTVTLETLDATGAVTNRMERYIALTDKATVEFNLTVPSSTVSLRAVFVSENSSTSFEIPVEVQKPEEPEIEAGTLKKGLPEKVVVRITNWGSADLSTEGAVLSAGGAKCELIGGRESIKPGETGVLTYRVVPSERGVLNVSFTLGNISAERAVTVRDPVSSPVLVLTDEFIKGSRATIAVVFRNTGSAPLEVRGVSILGMRRKVSRTLEPNETVRVRFTYNVPLDASDEMSVEAVVETDVGDFTGGELVETTRPLYDARVTVEGTYDLGQEVFITGEAYNSSGPVPDSLVRVAIARGDFVRVYYVITDENGRFNMTFRPPKKEAGHFIVSATHPSVVSLEDDGEFDIIGFTISPEVYKLRVSQIFNGTIRVRLFNPLGSSNVSTSVSAPEGYTVGIPERFEMPNGNSVVEIDLAGIDVSNGTINVTFTTNLLGKTVERTLKIEVEVLPPLPLLRANPNHVEAGILTNDSWSGMVTLENYGFEELIDVSVNSTIPWLKVVSNVTSLGPGETAGIALYARPPSNVTGTFDGAIRITASNHPPLEIPVRFVVTPEEHGGIVVVTMDTNGTRLAGASVEILNNYFHVNGTTDSNGTLSLQDIPVGDYTVFISKAGYYTYSGRILVETGVNRTVNAVMVPSTISVEWEVVPITIQDVYTIKHEIRYKTYVPAPQIDILGGDLEVFIDYEKLAEMGVAEMRGQVVVTNYHPYVSVFNVSLKASGSHYVDVEFAVDRIEELKPGETVVVPYVVRVYHHRSPPINPCSHEDMVLSLDGGMVCTEDVGLVQINAQTIHKIYVKTTCDGCLKSSALFAGKALMEGLIKIPILSEVSEILDDVSDVADLISVFNESAVGLSELYDRYAMMVINPTDENIKNFSVAFNAEKDALAKAVKNAGIGTAYAAYQISALSFVPLVDENGTIIGYSYTTTDPLYPKIMQNIAQVNEKEAIKALLDYEKDDKIDSIIDTISENVPIVGKLYDAMDFPKKVAEVTPYAIQAVLNCAACWAHFMCNSTSSANISIESQIATADFIYEEANGPSGFGGTSVSNNSCNTITNTTKTTTSTSTGISDGSGDYSSLHMCVNLVLTIEQKLAFERQGFQASLKFTNTNANLSLEDVNVTITFLDANASNADDMFFVGLENSDGLSGGTLSPGSTAKLSWLIIPKPGSAKYARTRYYVKATITGRIGNRTMTFKTWPARIDVEPVPQLELDYVLPGRVYGDDPYTPEKEEPVPFVFGVRVKNVGYGTAKNLVIESAQPKIERANYPGIYIDFSIIGTVVNGRSVPNSLTVDFGDLGPGQSSTAVWLMIAEVTGDFLNYTATFTHSDELGGEETSLIREVRTHFLVRAFEDTAYSDGMTDFLVDDDRDGVPDGIIDSTGLDFNVVPVNFTEESTGESLRILPDVRTGGWIFLRIPADGNSTVLRDDGSRPVFQWWDNGSLNVLDVGTAGFYVLKMNNPPVPVMRIKNETNGIVLDGSLSYDPDGEIVRYLWRLNNSTFEGETANVALQPGEYNVMLTVWDDLGTNASTSRLLIVSSGAGFRVALTVNPEEGTVPFNVTATANITNTGDEVGNYTAEILLDGDTLFKGTVYLEPGQSKLVEVSAEITKPGEHEVAIDNEAVRIKAYRVVTEEINETLNYTRNFGHYQSFTWNQFLGEFSNWSSLVLDNVSVPELGLQNESVNASPWELVSTESNLGIENGSLVAVYERNVTITGVREWNATTVLIHQKAVLNGTATREVDSEPPVVTVSPGRGIYDSVSSLNITVEDETNVTVRLIVNGVEQNVTLVSRHGNTSFLEARPELGKGNNTVEVIANDSFGNVAWVENWYYINPEAPSIRITSPEGRVYNENSVWLNYSVSDDDLKGAVAYLDGEIIAEGPNGSVLATLPGGWHSFTVVAWDVENNVSKTVSFRINDPPSVDFTWTADMLVVYFAANSSDRDGVVRYFWDFGDGGTSDARNPVHVYESGGTYTVTLTVWDAYSMSSSTSKVIEVFANVSLTRNESFAYKKDFGHYNTSSWETFVKDYEAWVNETLSKVAVNLTLDEIWNVKTSRWSLENSSSNLSYGSGHGWINSMYSRQIIVRGTSGHNMTTLLIVQRAVLFASATNEKDTTGPNITIISPTNGTYANFSEVLIRVSDPAGIMSVEAKLDGKGIEIEGSNGTWGANVTVSNGHHVLNVTAKDGWGNEASTSVGFTVNETLLVRHFNGTEVIVIPGKLGCSFGVDNGTIGINLWLGEKGVSMKFPLERTVVIDERLGAETWLAVSSGMELQRVLTNELELTRQGKKYKRNVINATVVGDGYAVLMIPRNGMDVVAVYLWKNGTKTALSTERDKTYYGILGDYVYVTITEDPTVEVILEKEESSESGDSHNWLMLGFLWGRWYLKLRGEFSELLQNVSTANSTKLEGAIELHEQAGEFYRGALKFYPGDPVRYAIYMRKAYILEKRALKILRGLVPV